jgi:hypothetical protein
MSRPRSIFKYTVVCGAIVCLLIIVNTVTYRKYGSERLVREVLKQVRINPEQDFVCISHETWGTLNPEQGEVIKEELAQFNLVLCSDPQEYAMSQMKEKKVLVHGSRLSMSVEEVIPRLYYRCSWSHYYHKLAGRGATNEYIWIIYKWFLIRRGGVYVS